MHVVCRISQTKVNTLYSVGVNCTRDILLLPHFTFIENPDGIIFFGHSKSVVLILLPDSINNMTFVSVLQGLKAFLRSVMCYSTLGQTIKMLERDL